MNTPHNDPAGIEPVDPDLAAQAVPGHGVPSQDPSVAAQVGLTPDEAEREAKSALAGGGAIAGLAAGAAAGAALGGPIGVLVGGMAGTLVGALGGEAVGNMGDAEPSAHDDRLRSDAEDAAGEAPSR